MNGHTKILVLLFALAVSSAALAQGTAQPTQPVDPTAQTPTTPIPSTPPTFPTPEAKGGASDTRPSDASPSSTTTSGSQSGKEAKARPFMGTIVSSQAGYVLRSGDLEYKLDDQNRAKQYDGKSVKVTGSLDKKNNSIHINAIELVPSF
ncbi:MAG TPA: DUF5818 domain-containing protein [Terriglobales bacterium]|nr:DUF5818 domain-containing protein [Terriglobales bacterium]